MEPKVILLCRLGIVPNLNITKYYRKFETNIINSFQKMWNNRANRRRNTEYLLFKRESVTLDLDLHDEHDYVDEYESLIRQ